MNITVILLLSLESIESYNNMEDSAKFSYNEKKILEDLSNEIEMLIFYRKHSSIKEMKFYDRAIDNFIEKITILNKQISGLVGNELVRRLEDIKKYDKEEKPSYKLLSRERKKIITEAGNLSISKDDKKRFLYDLKITKEEMKKLRRTLESSLKDKKKVPMSAYFRNPNPFVVISSKLFFKTSLSLSEKEMFKGLHNMIRKAALPFLLHSYISVMIFSTILAFIAGIIGAFIFTFVSGTQNILIDLSRNVVMSTLVPVFTFFLFYIYPYSQISTFKTKTENELPFTIMHMSTIAGSGVEPTRIFKIIALSRDYPAVGKEARKIINQINFYGYDIVGALRATARTASSSRLADLLNGMATIISTGGNLQSYLNKSSENALLDYRLKRQKYIETSATYADIYTGLLITAPLLFMLLLSLIKVIGLGMNIITLGIIGIGSIIVLNIAFLVFLHLSQPEG